MNRAPRLLRPPIRGTRAFRALPLLVVLASLLVEPVAAQFREDGWSFGWEIKGHLRDSEEVSFPVPFQLPFPATFGTVEPGEQAEISVITLDLRYGSPWLSFRAKVDGVDRHERNPTSTDDEIDADELWVKIGRGTVSGEMPQEPWGAYAKFGKFGKFERQEDRHLESYGLVSTAFNRLEDAGVELGVDFGRHVYLRGSFTQGNPVFLRDPNALAGDNGTDIRLDVPATPELGSGVVILYDAEVEYDLDFEEPEVGLGLGFRFGEPAGYWVLDFLGFYYERDLQDAVELEGTQYGGDLDILLGPLNDAPLGVEGREKTEAGFNVWFYRGGLSVFAQVVDQDLAGLERRGTEVEAAWRFPLPGNLTLRGHRLFEAIVPALRYSELDPEDFGGSGIYPAPSVRWPWEKWDFGVRVDVWRGLDLTLEHADNTFVTAVGERSMEETLLTLRWRGLR